MGRRRKTCDHPPRSSFIAYQAKDGPTVWRCSVCGKEDVWRDPWSLYGTIECHVCFTGGLQGVFCSERCARNWKPSDPKVALKIAMGREIP